MTAIVLRICAIALLALPTLLHAAVLRVVSDDNYPPYLFRDADGEIQGYAADIWKLWEKKTGVRVELTATHWAQAQRLLLEGQADVIDMIFRTPQRQAMYDFSAPYVKVPVAIYADASISGIHDVGDLRGFEVGVQNGDACVEKLQQAGISNMRLFANYSALLAAATAQDIKLFCIDEYPANYYLYRLAKQKQFVKAFNLYEDEFRRAVRKGDADTLALVNRGMALISAEEEDALRKKWLGQPIAFNEYARIFIQLLAALSIVMLGLLFWLRSLRNAVSKRTRELEREKAQWRTLVEGSPDLIWLKDSGGAYLAANQQVARLLGRTPAEIIGKTDYDFFDRDAAEFFRKNDRLALEAASSRANEEWVTFPDTGERRLLEVIKTPIAQSNGDVLGVLGVARDITERKRNEQKLVEQDALLKEMSAMAQIGAWEFDPATGQGHWTEEVARIHDVAAAGPTCVSYGLGFFHGENRTLIEGAINEAVRHGTPYDLEVEMVSAAGAHKWVRAICRPVVQDGKVEKVRGTIQDVTARRKLEESMRMANLIYQTSTEAIMVTDEDNNIVDVNPAFTRQTGYSLEEVLGQNPRIFSSGRHDRAFFQSMWQAISTRDHWQGEIWDRSKDGSLHVKFLNVKVIRHPDGRIYRHIAQFYDITEQKQKDELIWKQNNFDALTGLPNRRLFLDRLEQEVKKAHRTGKSLALMFIDLDRFKEINDTLGHAKGDALLVEVTRRITRCVRDTDTVARMGGDEFTIIMNELDRRPHLDRTAQDVIHALSAPFELGGGDVGYVSASVGITFYPDDGEDIGALMKNAEQAMYLAKKEGRSRFSYFTQSLQREAQEKLLLTNELRQALARNELQVYYQPIVDMASGRIVKAEALLRWKHPRRGMVSPASFIPLAEESGLIVDIGEWVFQEAISSIERWRRKFGYIVELSVNKSPVQFERAERYPWLDRFIESGMPRNSITVEITEGLLINDSAKVKSLLKRFQDAGLNVSIDDFGTGFSALSYLKLFDIDYLKIDKSFISNLTGDDSDKALTEAIIVMAHKLGIQTIAEGVETEAQRDVLIKFGCDYIQGYLYSRPVPRDEFEALLERQRPG